MDEFNVVWKKLQATLKAGIEIRNWNTYNGYLGDNLTIVTVDPNSISIDPPRVWDTQVIPKEGFEQVWKVWQDYRELRLKRSDMRKISKQSQYIISIFRWYEKEADY